MSLNSTNYLPIGCNIDNLYWIIEHLGYEVVESDDKSPEGHIRSYYWMHPDRDLTYVGIELSIQNGDNGGFEVHTRSRINRSYAELCHQNYTIKIIQDFFGGTFITDSGEGILLDSDDCNPERSKIAMALYIQRWKFDNAQAPMKIYSEFMDESFHHSAPAGDLYGTEVGILPLADYLRPCIYSANILIPYIVGVWENYVKNSLTNSQFETLYPM